MTNTAILLIEHLTEESNGFITAKSIQRKLLTIIGLRISIQTIAKYRQKYMNFYKLSEQFGSLFQI